MEEEAAAAAAGTAVASAESEAADKDDDERELEKLEKNDPEMLRICNVIIDQLEKFKVRARACLTNLCLKSESNCARTWLKLISSA